MNNYHGVETITMVSILARVERLESFVWETILRIR